MLLCVFEILELIATIKSSKFQTFSTRSVKISLLVVLVLLLLYDILKSMEDSGIEFLKFSEMDLISLSKLDEAVSYTHLDVYKRQSHFSQELPFDRHDWIVLRGERKAEQQPPAFKEVRYILDFYGGPDDENGMPTFHVDVRPALDSLDNAKDRMTRFLDRMISGPSSSSSAP